MSGNGEPESTDSLKQFGAVLKAFRERAEMTQEALARRVQFSPATVASIEQGRRLPPPRFIERAGEVLDALGVLKAAAQYLSRQPGLAAWFRQWAELEEQAISLYTYECRLIPGLLQTEAYARTLFDERVPPLTDEESETQVAARLARQELLRTRPNTAFSFIVDEHILQRRTGGVEPAGDFSTSCWSTRRSAGTSSSKSCRYKEEFMLAWMAQFVFWRHRTSSGSPTPRGKKAASSSPTQRRSAPSTCGMQNCGRRPSPPRTPGAC